MRAETGVMQFEDDWPGVFIRGDNAFGLLQSIRAILAAQDAGRPVSPIMVAQLRSFADLLASSDVRTNPAPQRAILKPILKEQP